MKEGDPIRTFRFLDSAEDREALIRDIQDVRNQVIAFADRIPPEEHFTPRYHGWSLAAMLMHLYVIDTMSTWQISLAAAGINLPVPLPVLNAFNDLCARIFRKRILSSTVKLVRQREANIIRLIRNFPVERFSRQVFYPPTQKQITVEQALQVLFHQHWLLHLATMEGAHSGMSLEE